MRASGRVPLSRNAVRVLESRYLRRDRQHRVIETPEELFSRVARAIARAESAFHSGRQSSFWEEEFYRLLASLDFLPNSPTLMNAGTPVGQLSACFVIPVEDTMEGIFEAVKEMALVQRTGGGTGFSFSRLRPRGDVVASTGGAASGPVSFMKVFDCATENIKQGGKRRGANMGVLRVDHPDVMEFIAAKREEGAFQNFNLSVGVTDAFMEAVQRDHTYELLHPSSGLNVGRLRAREVFNAITAAAWQSGDPGVLFLDAINRANPTPHLGPLEVTNPCGEVPLLPYESCNLGSINLAHMMRDHSVDWETLGDTVHKAVRFLDNVIEVSTYPGREFEAAARRTRKIGLGVMGFANLLIGLGVSYDSDEAVNMGGRIMRFISGEAQKASQVLAGERGMFPAWTGSLAAEQGRRLRNATCTAIAPTGTISIIAGASASIEPLFALAYRRSHTLGGEQLLEVNPQVLEHLERHHLSADDIQAALREYGNLSEIPAVPDAMKRLFVTALEIPHDRHLEMQAAFQRHVDNSVSKTVNLPQATTPETIAAVYRRAWGLGLKGVTVYRYGSKSTQVLQLGLGEEPYQYDHAAKCDPTECRV